MKEPRDRLAIAAFNLFWYAVPCVVYLAVLYGVVRFIRWAWEP